MSLLLLFPASGAQHYSLDVSVGSVGLSGVSAGLSVGRKVQTSVGAFVLTGNDAALVAPAKLNADSVAFNMVGVAAALSAGRKLSAATGSVEMIGLAADFTYQPAVQKNQPVGTVNKHYKARFRRLARKRVKLEGEAAKTERKIAVERSQGKPVDGILAKYRDISTKLESTKTEFMRLEVEFRTLSFDDEDDIEVLLVS